MFRRRTNDVIGTLVISCFLSGCFSSESDSPAETAAGAIDSGAPVATPPTPTEVEKVEVAQPAQERWEDYPDVPYVPIMTDVNGIEIPRLKTESETLQLKGEIPSDVGNLHAKERASERAKGDWLIVRFSAEPKTLNPITETSAVQSYIGDYVQEPLARLNPETLEFEPHVAERWVAEDSVKLSSDYKGKERRIALEGGTPAGELEVNYEKAKKEGEEDPVLKFATSSLDGQSVGGVWVGLFPVGEVPGAPTTGYHFWSDSKGKLEVHGIVSGKYKAHIGTEIFGTTNRNDDGSLTVTPKTPGNPLEDLLDYSQGKPLLLAKGDWVDVQEKTIYTFFLRNDVKWSDGEPFTTKDLEFAYAVMNNSYVDGESIRVYYQDLVSCEALGTYTIRMKYRQQYFKAFDFTSGLAAFAPPFHVFRSFFEKDGKVLTLETLTPDEEQAQKKVSAHGQAFGKFFNTDDRYNLAPVGTGPYIVDKWVRADRVELLRNESYWHPERAGHLDRLIFKFIPDNVTALQALKAGEVDFLSRMSPEQFFEDLKGPPDWFKDTYVKASWFIPAFSYYGWNSLRPMFADRKVRIALSMLFNKQEFLEKKLHNAGVVVAGSQYYFGIGYDHTVAPLGYDPDVAQELLAEAGWVDTDNDGILDKGGQKFEFQLILPPGNPTALDRAAIIQKSYKQAGIQMEIRQFEWASFIDKVKAKDFEAVNLGWASPLESDPFQIWHGSQAGAEKRGSNHVSFSDPLADQLIESIRVTLDEAKRKCLHASMQRILDREQPYMFLYTLKNFAAYHERFRGVKWYRLRPGYDFREWYVPKDEQLH